VRIPQKEIAAQAENLREALRAHPEVEVGAGPDMPVLKVGREKLLEVMRGLRDGPEGFDFCSFVTAVDHIGEKPRFEVVYVLQATARHRWLRVKTFCGEFDAHVPSVSGIWPGANWQEREVWDMFGIRFEGHPDLRRLLMPEGYGHHPLRKDFPREGIEPGRLYREWESKRPRPEAGR